MGISHIHTPPPSHSTHNHDSSGFGAITKAIEIMGAKLPTSNLSFDQQKLEEAQEKRNEARIQYDVEVAKYNNGTGSRDAVNQAYYVDLQKAEDNLSTARANANGANPYGDKAITNSHDKIEKLEAELEELMKGLPAASNTGKASMLDVTFMAFNSSNQVKAINQKQAELNEANLEHNATHNSSAAAVKVAKKLKFW